MSTLSAKSLVNAVWIRRRLPDVLAVAILLASVVLYYRAVTLSNSILLGFDVFTYFYPNEQFAADALRKGSLPLWNPYLFSGVPFLANMQTAVFYPPNVVFLLTSVPRAYAYSVVLHAFLAGLFTYLFCRVTLRLGPAASLAGASTFAFSGFLGSLVGHLNQLHAAAWLPLLLTLVHQSWRRRSLGLGILGGTVLAMQLLAGHAQESYMTMALLLVFVAHEAWRSLRASGWIAFRGLAPLLSMAVVGVGLAAVQLAPALELSAQSIRAGGMPYQEAVSFSFPPWMLSKGLLPAYADPQPFSEFLGFVGVLGLILCLYAASVGVRRPFVGFFALVAVGSALLALGQFNPLYPVAFKVIPGLNLFRVPARWLFLYTFSISVLVGFGVSYLGTRLDARKLRKVAAVLGASIVALLALLVLSYVAARFSSPADVPSGQTLALWGLAFLLALALVIVGVRGGGWIARTTALALILVELFFAGQFLDLNRANVPEAYSSMRPAIAHFLADRSVYRVLALSENTFDPGDISEIKAMLGQVRSPAQIYDFLVATKLKETLMPNIPLRYSIATFDGYDGGLLPLKRYADFKQLLAGKSPLDTRLREDLKGFPESRLLEWLNIKYVLMDRIRDAWVDGTYYDLAFSAPLDASGGPLRLSALPSQETTSIGVVSHLVGGADLEDGVPLATLVVTDSKGKTFDLPMRAGLETAEGRWQELDARKTVMHRQARKAKAWKDDPGAWDYVGRLSLPEPIIPREIVVRPSQPRSQLVIRGISLIDERTQSSRPVTLSDSFKLVHVGDVKIYENKQVLPRAFVVYDPVVVADDAEALRALSDSAFRPSQQVVLLESELRKGLELDRAAANRASGSYGDGERVASIDLYEPNRVIVKVSLRQPGFLVLTDSHYPGWRAMVDGEERPILRANYLFRAVELAPGEHLVEFKYEPASVLAGSLVSASLLLALVAFLAFRIARTKWPKWRGTCSP